MGSGTGRRRVWQGVRVRLYSRREAVGLRRDLSVPFMAPPAKIPLIVRPLRPDDDLSFIAEVPELAPQAARQRIDQRLLLTADIPTCWIAIDPDGTACYMQWLIAPRDNALVRARWGGLFPELQPDEALLEGAYTADSHRGQGIMSHAMARISERARPLNPGLSSITRVAVPPIGCRQGQRAAPSADGTMRASQLAHTWIRQTRDMPFC